MTSRYGRADRAAPAGARGHGLQAEATLAVRGLPVLVHEQVAEHHTPIDIPRTASNVRLGTAFLITDTTLRPTADEPIRHILHLRLLSLTQKNGFFIFGTTSRRPPTSTTTSSSTSPSTGPEPASGPPGPHRSRPPCATTGPTPGPDPAQPGARHPGVNRATPQSGRFLGKSPPSASPLSRERTIQIQWSGCSTVSASDQAAVTARNPQPLQFACLLPADRTRRAHARAEQFWWGRRRWSRPAAAQPRGAQHIAVRGDAPATGARTPSRAAWNRVSRWRVRRRRCPQRTRLLTRHGLPLLARRGAAALRLPCG